MRIPQKIFAGDSVTWYDEETTDNLGGAIAPGAWALTYVLRGTSSLDVVATVENGQWKTTLTAAQTAELTPGTYYWQAVASYLTQRVTLGSGQLQVAANLVEQADGYDGRSQARKDLEAVQAAIRAIVAGGAVAEYTIGNRSLRKMDIGALLSLESKLKADVVREEKAEKIKQGLGNPNNLYVRFK